MSSFRIFLSLWISIYYCFVLLFFSIYIIIIWSLILIDLYANCMLHTQFSYALCEGLFPFWPSSHMIYLIQSNFLCCIWKALFGKLLLWLFQFQNLSFLNFSCRPSIPLSALHVSTSSCLQITNIVYICIYIYYFWQSNTIYYFSRVISFSTETLCTYPENGNFSDVSDLKAGCFILDNQ